MGSGKSTIAKILAKNLSYAALDLDDYIVEREGKSIEKIFKERGEVYFRKIEGEYLREILESNSNLVLALGGGTPCYGNNLENINLKSRSIYLKGSIKTLFSRLEKEKSQRPLISSLDSADLTEFVAKHLFERRNFYEKADLIISVDGKSAEEIAAEILNEL